MADIKTDFEERSYFNHAAHMEKLSGTEERALSRLKNQDNIDNWRHKRMLEQVKTLFSAGNKWLTVGDGVGTDANYLISQNLDVLATDISDSVLRMAAKQGLINEFKIENAEKLSFSDQTFDYVVCKEAYHHFPRPYIALYEMLRVAKQAVVLMEPQDPILKMPLLLMLSNIFNKFDKHLLRKFWKNQYSFETVGNFVYKISEREIEKIAIGMNFRYVAFKGLHDYYNGSAKFGETPIDQGYFSSIKRKIKFRNFISKLGLFPFQNLCVIIFKNNPDPTLIEKLKTDGFDVYHLPENPYI